MGTDRIAVMASGKGSNLKAILRAVKHGECQVDVRLVLSDKPDAGALDIARAAGVPEIVYQNPKDYENREAFDDACADVIEAAACNWIVLAGYMRILSAGFVGRFRNRIVNIHPALLPAFPGGHAVEDALRYGVKITGCTIHLVDEVVDGGPILSQAAVPVLDSDTVESLHNRIHAEEHRLYPATLNRLVKEGFHIRGRRVIWGKPSRSPA
jgi:phosphoribosylglycinamide formyltransferase-1